MAVIKCPTVVYSAVTTRNGNKKSVLNPTKFRTPFFKSSNQSPTACLQHVGEFRLAVRNVACRSEICLIERYAYKLVKIRTCATVSQRFDRNIPWYAYKLVKIRTCASVSRTFVGEFQLAVRNVTCRSEIL